MARRLYRVTDTEMIGGVCGGLAEYFDIDTALVRIAAAIGLFISFGTAFLIYLVAWIIIPPKSDIPESELRKPGNGGEVPRENPKWHSLIPGLLLVGLGVILLLREYVYWFGFGELWPVLLIVLGVLLIAYTLGRRRHSAQESPDSSYYKNSTDRNHGGQSA